MSLFGPLSSTHTAVAVVEDDVGRWETPKSRSISLELTKRVLRSQPLVEDEAVTLARSTLGVSRGTSDLLAHSDRNLTTASPLLGIIVRATPNEHGLVHATQSDGGRKTRRRQRLLLYNAYRDTVRENKDEVQRNRRPELLYDLIPHIAER